jgi:F0F1-type ATP synthase membrane subunit c/vacuolar-type H+-ATPase subunit K
MTRYTFVLLVLRTIGVLSAAYFVAHCVHAADAIVASPPLQGGLDPGKLPFDAIAIALAVPLAGMIGGTCASRLANAAARNSSRPEIASPLLTSLALAAVICAIFCIGSVGNAQLEAIYEWRFISAPLPPAMPGFPQPAAVRFMGAGPDLIEAAAYLLALGALFGMARSANRTGEAP